MKSVIAVVGSLLLVFGATLLACSRQSRLPDGQAGVAYVESEDGQLVVADDGPKAEGTPAPTAEEIKTIVGGDESWLTKFELTERSGKTVTSEQLKGQPYVVSFFFSLCPSICLRQNEKVQQLQEKFKNRPVRFVSISCDPEVDKPAVLSQYANKFGADKDQWMFLTGDLTYIRRVGAEMYFQPVAWRSHTEKFVLIDAAGNQVGYYTWTDPGQWQALQADLDRLLQSGGTFSAESQPAESPPAESPPADADPVE
ncbi:MAG: SCO family protein [Planctomycetales bacterium]|nr:SCO family protein [Planctomycetales bacterium]